MSAKAILVFCAQALFVQSALSQCTSRAYGYAVPGLAAPYGLDAPAWAAPCGWFSPAIDFTPISGGGLPVTSASAIAPVGLFVASENAYNGILAAVGELPFVGTVAVESVVPSAGAGAVNHSSGNGINAIVSETAAFAPGYAGAVYAPAAAIAPGFAASGYAAPGCAAPDLGYRAGFAGRGCGCGL